MMFQSLTTLLPISFGQIGKRNDQYSMYILLGFANLNVGKYITASITQNFYGMYQNKKIIGSFI